MRTIVDIPEADLQFLAEWCAREKISRAEAVRRAVAFYREQREKKQQDQQAERKRILEETFGAWKDDPFWKNADSVDYVRSLRAEWDREWDPD